MWTSVCKGMLLLLCGLAATAGVAPAQEDRVFVDPDSPSGKEYELPIDRAREQAAPSRQNQGSEAGAQGTPLFGEGVEPEQGRAAGATTPGKVGTRDDGGEDAASGAPAQRASAGATAARTAQAAAPAGGTGLAAIIGAGAGVLVVGGLLGLLLRRRAAR